MRYPTLNVGRTGEFVKQLLIGEDPSIEGEAYWRGEGESVEFDALDIVLARLRKKLMEEIGEDPSLTTDKEPFEGEVAVAVFDFLHSLPVEVLDDPGFWRFLAVSRFWWFIRWRESGPIESGNVGTYTDGRRNTEQIPLRLYLRVKAVADAGSPDLAKDLEWCTDFWRSHVIRVRTGAAPALAAQFAAQQKGPGRLKTDPLRDYARRLNRLWTNVHFGLYGQEQAKAVIEELRE